MSSNFHKEIEVKARLKSFSQIKANLEKLGCVFSSEIIQKDTNYINKESTFPYITPGCQALRIREEGDKVILTFKESVDNELDKIEREVLVSDKGQMEDIIKMVGFLFSNTISKKRIKTTYKGMEVCLDSVENLGDFIEIEKLTDEDDGEKVQEELMLMLEELGVSRDDRVFKGYDTLLATEKATI